MTISATTNRVSAAGDGTTTVFAFAFPYRDHTDLKVYSRVTATGVETLKTEGADYTLTTSVADATNGGFDSTNVTMVTAPAAGTTLIISREVAPTQALHPTLGGGLGAGNFEGALDRLTLNVQWALDQLTRAIKFTRGTAAAADIPLPELPAGTDTQFLGINAARNAFVFYASSTLSAGQAVSSFVATLLAAASAAAFRTLIGFQQIRVTAITYDPANLTNGSETESANISATGCVFGDHVQVFPPYDMQGIQYWGYVKVADNVRIRLRNGTGGTLDLANSAAWEIRVSKGGQA